MDIKRELRLEKLKRSLSEKGIDGYLVLYAPNRFYLTGFELHDPQCNESAGCLIVTKEDVWLCTDSRYEEVARRIFWEDRVFIYKQRLKDLKDFIKKLGIKTLGFEADILTYEAFEEFKKVVNMKPFKRGLVEEIRIVKDEEEIDYIKKACELNHRAFSMIEDTNLNGISERHLAWELEKFFKENGAQELAFAPIVASGTNSAFPHHLTSEVKIKENQILLVDMGCRVDWYCCDHTRTFWIGTRVSQRFKKVLVLVKEAQTVAIENIRAGVRARDLYMKVVNFFEVHGIEKHFIHSLGHGVGLEAHEAPSLGPRSNDILEENMVITVEPGLYFPDWGGVRWEDMVVVKKNGCEVL